MNELSKYLVESILAEDKTDIKDVIVVYVGRFQPMHQGHYAVYEHLTKKFGKKNVFVGSSDKTDSQKSPFNFKEKQEIAKTMFGIPKNRFVKLKSPYAPTEVLKQFDPKTTAFITVVGEKDKSRLSGKYFEKYDGEPTEGYDVRGYVYTVPILGKGVSGTEVRNGLKLGGEDQRKDFFKDRVYGKYNEKIFRMVTDKLQEEVEIPKEVIEDYLINEVTFINPGAVDDGPVSYFPNLDVYNQINVDRATKIGYEVVNMVLNKDLEDYYEHPIYPDGPVNANTFFPAGVMGAKTATNQVDIYNSSAYDKWLKHVTRQYALIGYELIDSAMSRNTLQSDKKSSGDSARDNKDIQDEFEHSINEVAQKIHKNINTSIKENKIDELAGTSVDCQRCNHSWEIEGDDPHPYLCHNCGFDNQKMEYDHDEFNKWKKEQGIKEGIDGQERLDFYEKYFKNLTPSLTPGFDVRKETDGIKITIPTKSLNEFDGGNCEKRHKNETQQQYRERCFGYNPLTPPAGMSETQIREFVSDCHKQRDDESFMEYCDRCWPYNPNIPHPVSENVLSPSTKMKDYEKKLVASLSKFMQNKLGFSAKITIKKKNSKSLFGDLVLSPAAMKGKITLHYNPSQGWGETLKSLTHELIHAKQVVKGELKPSKDYKSLVWGGKEYPVRDINKMIKDRDVKGYKNLPWEKEAYRGMNKYYKMFVNSKYWDNLVGEDPNLDYILSNLNEGLRNDIDEVGVGTGQSGVRMGYPSKDDLKKRMKDVETQRKKTDSNKEYQYQPINEGKSFVICRECGEKMKQVQYRHLKYKHQMTIDEYKNKYPTAPLVCENAKNIGDKNPMKNDDVKKNHLKSLNTPEYKKKISEVMVGKNKGNERPDVVEKNKDKNFRKKVSNGVKKSYNNNHPLLASRSENGKKYGFGNKKTQATIAKNRGYLKPEDKHPFQLYTEMVRTKTNENYQRFFSEIDNAKKRSRDFHLGHKYSIKQGFDNNIPVEVISHYKNLQILDGRLNESKGTKSSLTLNELITDIQNSNNPLDKRTLLLCGGAYGHMSHPFDTDINLTFGDLKDIVNRALDGNLETTTEKLDGQALAISYRKDRGLIAARNKSHLKNSGAGALDINGVSDKFKGRGGLTDAYNFAMRDLSKAINSLSDKQKEKIFQEGKSFMNLEVIFPTSVNVIPYGEAFLVFHGTMQYDDDGNAVGENKEAARILAGMIQQVNQDVQDAYTIKGPPVLELPKRQDLSNKKGKYNKMISKLQKEFKLKDTDGVGEYHQAWWENYVDKNSPSTLDNKTKMGLVKRWAFDIKKFRLDKKNIPDEKVLEWAKTTEKENLKKIQKDNLMKFENIFLGVGAEVLQFTSSALAANPDKSIRDMKKRIDQTIKDVKKSGDPKKIEKLKLELQRLKSIGGVDKIVPNEGIVFTYKGKTLKLTGTFAPANQILGIFFG